MAIILASAGNLLISVLFNFQTSFFEDVFRASIIPIFLAPLLSWHLVGMFYQMDILEKEMSRLAKVDDLTSVCNRRFFYKQIEDWLGAKLNIDTKYAFFVIDLDVFKGINDRYGHLCGDKVLQKFGCILREQAPVSSVVGRLGGEEFAIFVPNMDAESAETLAKNICQRTRDIVVKHNNISVSFSVSIGFSININYHKSTIENAFKYADLALYEAKESGRDCYRLSIAEENS
ncbi:GGDEF domain-containing protein [Marinomonas rhizomae]|uniref:GGDEF domain-containing protein n=1 Tax=Marinomonas rhizomae TaxID=491948 RepID=UPI0021029DE8|nr:GGDEF domain-containing protein [Marinomonas rhizomae]UTW00356.1 GGDEF domain-containing protein [Marinomonas rhizomae]